MVPRILAMGTVSCEEQTWFKNYLLPLRRIHILLMITSNSLAVKCIPRPVTDRFYVSRAKLAYILDSYRCPMCVIMPA